MKTVVIFLVLLTASEKCIQQETGTTLNIHQRVALLKHKIVENIQQKHFLGDKILPIEQHDIVSSLEYADDFTDAITPINEKDERKKHGSFKLRQIKTTTVTPWVRTKPTKDMRAVRPNQPARSKKRKPIVADDISTSLEVPLSALRGIDSAFTQPKLKPIKSLRHKSYDKPDKTFYRRMFPNLKIDCANQLVHCQELITPFLAGTKTNISEVKSIKYSDHVVFRLVQLINEDTAEMSKEEIYSILYQISNLQIRLFQWELNAIKLLLKTVTKESTKRHTFRALKRGIKQMLVGWHLDYHNISSLLQQTRLFRPPCIQSDLSESSTLSSHVTHFTKKVTKRKCQLNSEDSSCEN